MNFVIAIIIFVVGCFTGAIMVSFGRVMEKNLFDEWLTEEFSRLKIEKITKKILDNEKKNP